MKKRLKIKKRFLIIIFFIIILVLLSISPYLFVNIRLVGDSNMVSNYGNKFSEPGYKAYIFNKDITNDIKVSGSVLSDIGTYKITYYYNFLFYKIKKVRTITVSDIVGPKITLTEGNSIDVTIDEEYKEKGFTAIDNVDGDITDKVIIKGEVDTSKLGEYKITYEAVDSSGNKSIVSRKVNVVRKNPSTMSISEYSLAGWYDEVKLKETKNYGDDYFNNIIMIGDSNIKNMYEYGVVKGENAWASPCINAESMHYLELNLYGYNTTMTLINAIEKYKPKRIILNFGSFSSLWITDKVFTDNASSMIEKIKKVSPDTDIIIASIYPVTKNGINNDHFDQNAINKCNFILLELASQYKIKYLDVQEVLKDSSGYGNPSYYINDGFHLTNYGQKLVKEYINTHAVEE